MNSRLQSTPGLGLLISVGAWGGFSFDIGAWGFRLGLGWAAISFMTFDGDALLQLASAGIDSITHAKRAEEFNAAIDALEDKLTSEE